MKKFSFKNIKYFSLIVVLVVVQGIFFSSVFAWTSQTGSVQGAWRSIASSADGTRLTAVIYSGSIYTSNDSGVTWSVLSGAASRNWYDVAMSDSGQKIVALDNGGYIYTSSDYGVTWTTNSNSSGSRGWTSVASSKYGTNLVATNANGYIYTSNDSGVTWTEQTNAGTKNWYDVSSSEDGTKLAAVIYGGYIYTSNDSGVTWTTNSNSSGYRNWYSISSSEDGTKLSAAVFGDYIYTSNDSGVTWTTNSNSSGARSWRGVDSSSDGSKLIGVVLGGYVYVSIDRGVTWTEQTSLGTKSWRGVTSSLNGEKVAAIPYNDYIQTNYFDYTPPVISSISSDKVNGGYTVGEIIDIDVTFSEAVTSTGNVLVTLETGSTDRTCSFALSNATSGTCNYTVQAGDTSSDLTVLSVSGTISDQSGNSMTDFSITTNLADNKNLIIDTAIPVILSSSPTTDQPSGTTDIELTLTTDENANCKYDTLPNVAYSSMSGVFDTTGGTSHSESITGLVDDTDYVYYVRCSDLSLNKNTTDFEISFSVEKEIVIEKNTEERRRKKPSSRRSIPIFFQDNNLNQEPASIEQLLASLKSLISTGAEKEKITEVVTKLKSEFEALLKIINNTTVLNTFTKNLEINTIDEEVRTLQKFLNSKGYAVSTTGPGSFGNETNIFGSATRDALIKFQTANNITPAQGYFGSVTRGFVNNI